MPLSPKYTEEELINLLKSKEEKAFNYLYDNYSTPLYSIIYKIIGTETVAADVLQEVFLRIWKNIDKYHNTKGSLFTWMLNIARNTAIDMLRSKDFRNQQQNQSLENNVSNNEGDSVLTSIDHIGLLNVIMQLKEEYRILIELAYFRGYTQEEIAKELNISIGTIKTRSRNALAELRSILKK